MFACITWTHRVYAYDLLLKNPTDSNQGATVVSQDTIAEWNGYYTLPKNISVEYKPEPLPYYINSYIGIPYNNLESIQVYHYNPEKVYAWVENITTTVNRQAQEPLLTLSGNRAIAFTSPSSGIIVDTKATTLAILTGLEQNNTEVTMAITVSKPHTSLADLNSLGISERIAVGRSSFRGSPNNRRHNIKIGVEKMKGVIIAPGEEFSFNKYLGPVEASAGFLPELVIKRDKGTVPELGGGLCQVSTTVFRAAMDAGLPITQRRNHAYAVQYYSPQGTDATIYPGIVDLKFTNDTGANILVWPYFEDDNTLIFEFYGTKDARVVTIEKPIQYDRKTDGSMKASWTRSIANHGQTTTTTFKSVYLPPALFHKEEKFIPTTAATIPSSQTTTNPSSPIETTTSSSQ